MNRILLLLISSLISACTATGPIYKAAENVDANKALVYVYRGTAFALGARSAYFYVDGINVFDLDQGGYSWVTLSPGRHTLRQRWPVDVTTKAVEFEIDVRAGETRYFSFQTGGCQGGATTRFAFNGNSALNRRRWELLPLSTNGSRRT